MGLLRFALAKGQAQVQVTRCNAGRGLRPAPLIPHSPRTDKPTLPLHWNAPSPPQKHTPAAWQNFICANQQGARLPAGAAYCPGAQAWHILMAPLQHPPQVQGLLRWWIVCFGLCSQLYKIYFYWNAEIQSHLHLKLHWSQCSRGQIKKKIGNLGLFFIAILLYFSFCGQNEGRQNRFKFEITVYVKVCMFYHWSTLLMAKKNCKYCPFGSFVFILAKSSLLIILYL